MLLGTPPSTPAALLLLRLDALPVREHFVGVLCREVAEDVRVPVDELVHDPGDDVVDREPRLRARELRLKDDLKQEISHLFLEDIPMGRVDGVDDLAGLFVHVLAERLEGLFAIPGAPARAQEALHESDESRKGRAVLHRERRYGARLVLVERRG